jgi:hypothetical protein
MQKEGIMTEKADNKKEAKKKSFFAGLLEKLDKKMAEKAKSQPCCCKPVDKKGDSCCS